VSKWPKWLQHHALFQLVAWMCIIGILVAALIVSSGLLMIPSPWDWPTRAIEWYLFWVKVVGYGFLDGTPQVDGH
jgi:hypothetical protein